ncbi:DUF1566 domain-containing protein [Myxococcota bacterium]
MCETGEMPPLPMRIMKKMLVILAVFCLVGCDSGSDALCGNGRVENGEECESPDGVCGSGCVIDREWAAWPLPPDAPADTDYTVDTDIVTDNVTNLVWQRNVHYSRRTWEEAVTYCEDLVLTGHNDWHLPNGHNDWHLPTVIELSSIFDFGRMHPAFNTAAFPATPDVEFWSSTSYAGDTTRVWSVYFMSLISFQPNDKSHSNYVRCVRGGPLVADVQAGAPPGRFTALADTVVDNVTGLLWQRSVPQSEQDWTSAVTHCDDMELSSFNDWRLPKAKELLSIVDRRAHEPAIDASVFPGTPSSRFWSSSPIFNIRGGSVFMACVSFADGHVNIKRKTSTRHVRCVRNGP